jgi:hypothetical protein
MHHPLASKWTPKTLTGTHFTKMNNLIKSTYQSHLFLFNAIKMAVGMGTTVIP